MLRATILNWVRALSDAAAEVAISPLPEAGPYLVRLPGRVEAERVAAGLLAGGPERILRADPVGDGLLFLTPGPHACQAALDEVAAGVLPPSPADTRERVLLEYVSADPNTALTLVHAREGVVGDALARLFQTVGHTVWREYYVNDAPGAALRAFAAAVESREGAWASAIAESLPPHPDLAQIVAEARRCQGAALTRLGVTFDADASENALRERGAVEATLGALRASGYTDEHGGALWLRTSPLGDDQDRVLSRPGGEPTYLAGDLAYHRDKFERGFTRLIDLWDADHRGYIARTHAGLKALGCPEGALQVVVCGPVRCLKDGTEVRGGRYGGFVSLEEVLDESAPEELRWRLLRAAPESPLDLPLGADAIVEQLHAARRRALSAGDSTATLPETLSPEEAALLAHLLEWPGQILDAVETCRPHLLAHWAETLAACLETAPAPRLAFVAARALARTLALLGVAEEEES